MPDETHSALRRSPVFKTAEAGLCITDAAGIFLRVNDLFCRLHGRGESDLVGHSAAVLAEGSDWHPFAAGYIDLIRGVLGERAELRFPAPGQPALHMTALARAMAGMAGGRFTLTTVTVDEGRQSAAPGGFVGSDSGLAIFAMIGDGMIGANRAGLIDSFDAGAERLFGYSAAEVLGGSVSMLMPESYAAHHDRYMAEAALHGRRTGERQRKLCGRRKDGTNFPILLLLGERPEGSLPGYNAVVLHDGDHEMNRSSLEQTSARLYDALGNLNEGFLLCDARDRVVLANGRMRSLLPEIADMIMPGTPFSEIVRACAERGLYRPGTLSLTQWVAERLMRHRQLPSHFEMDLRGGRRIEVRELATAEGACLTVYDDVTERHQREQQLREREIQLSTAQRIAKLGGWRVDLKTGEVSWSQEMYRLFGVEPDAFRPSTDAVLACIHPEDRQRVRRLLMPSGRGREVREWEFRITRPTGEERVLWAESQCERDPSGQVAARFGVCQDITARKLDQRALILAKEAAELANRSKSQFLANMSHELRTPLNAIIGFSEMMATEVLGPLGSDRYRDYAAAILTSGSHLLALINDVLDLSKIEAGRYELSDEWLSVSDAFEDAVRLVGPHAAEKGMVVDRTAKLAPKLRADRRALRQMLLNLLSNAVKFTPAGGSITLNAVWDFSGLRLEVTDTGAGIPADRIRDLARPFVQVDTAMNRRHTGSGIGLYLTRSLVELHNGNLTITSRQGESSGTTVCLHFPTERMQFYVED
ncbi:MAG: PAS domain S-box protein [Rhodospirillaceae bacterium]